ncbi:hypothetical protein BGW41_008395 [Actinomortierella wolfii]|nr:hypothetical protein BGW41_008395 [Actinomortierella wolfii]
MASSINVIIAGGGIAGLSLAIFLERAGIRYTVLEKAPEYGPWGAAVALSPQALRVYDQLGLFQEMQEIGIDFSHVGYYKYGYMSLFFSRPELLRWLKSKVPSEKILLGKRIQSTTQNENGVKIFCTDGSSYDADILIGADGAYSAVRQSLYQNLAKKTNSLPPSDTAPLRFDQFCILGITKPLDHRYPELKNAQVTPLHMTMASEQAYTVGVHILKGGRIGWSLKGVLLDKEEYSQENSFRFSEWNTETIEAYRKDIDGIPTTIGENLGNLIDNTEYISNVMIEDKLFETWYDGRICLIGDAAHKMVPAAGQGANQAILDAICIANLLHEMSSPSSEDIEKVFKRYYDIRYPTVKKAISGSAGLGSLFEVKGFFGNLLRKFVLSLPTAITQKALDAMNSGRPLLNFVDPIPLRGSVPNTCSPYTFDHYASPI